MVRLVRLLAVLWSGADGSRKMSVVAAIGAGIVGYLIGSFPTAEWLGKRAAVDLRREGSTNPGANNALRLAGPRLAAAVLTTEMAKGVIAVVAGAALAGDIGAVVAGVGAVTGNVFNSYYGFRGGKGLGISAGVLAAIWPTVLVPVLAVLVITVLITRSSGTATIVTLSPSTSWPYSGPPSFGRWPGE